VRKHLSILAALVALGLWSPTSMALTADDVVCKGCVGAKDIAGGAVNAAKLKNGAVRTKKIKNWAVTTKKIRNGAVTLDKLSTSAKAALTANVGSVSVAAHAFRDEGNPDVSGDFCVWQSSVTSGYGYYRSGSRTDCDPAAGVQLPDGATVTSLSCTVYDNYANYDVTLLLQRVDLSTGTRQVIFATPDSSDNASIQVLEDTMVETAGYEVIDNAAYAYSVVGIWGSRTDASSVNVGLYGCSIAYE